MKSKWTSKTFVTACLLCAGLVLPVTSCASCPDCKPVLNCTPPGPDGGPEITESEPTAAVSNVPCSAGCLATPPGAGFACMAHTGACDSGKCKLKLKTMAGGVMAQCGEGSLRGCTTTDGLRGITRCNTTACEFPNPSASGCEACGHQATKPCCVGGCDPGLRCSDPSNGPGSTCVAL